MNLPLDWRTDTPDAVCLCARDVGLQRGGQTILDGIDLTAHPGRLLALVGPNGAGKSSLLGLLAGLQPPSRGAITLDGRALARWPIEALARRRAMLSQHVQLGFGFRAWEVVGLALGPSYEPIDETTPWIAQALRAAHALHLRDRRYTELSGGEQRRVQLARVLAQLREAGTDAPPWLLLDEPEAGLDVAHQHAVLQRAVGQARRGWGVIAVLHDLNLAARYADDVALLAGGRLLRHGPAAQVLEDGLLSSAYGLPLRSVTVDTAVGRVIVAA